MLPEILRSGSVESLVGQLVTALSAVKPVLDAALEDRVNQVFVTGLRLLKRALRAVNDCKAASRCVVVGGQGRPLLLDGVQLDGVHSTGCCRIAH